MLKTILVQIPSHISKEREEEITDLCFYCKADLEDVMEHEWDVHGTSFDGDGAEHSYRADTLQRYIGLDYIRELIAKGEI